MVDRSQTHLYPVAQENSGAKKFKNQTELAVVNTSGNTDVLTLSLKNALAYDFSQKFKGNGSEKHGNFKIETETVVITALNKLAATNIAYEVRYQNRPSQDRLPKTDTVFSGSLVVIH